MNAIVNVSLDWGIGYKGDMLVHISEDLKRFRALTEGGTVIMGRGTLESLPGGRGLKNRRNIVLTTRPNELPEGVEGASSPSQLLDMVDEDAFVIGGHSVYELLLPYCSKVYVTKTRVSLPADRYFPNLDEMPDWKITQEGPLLHSGQLEFSYITYERV